MVPVEKTSSFSARTSSGQTTPSSCETSARFRDFAITLTSSIDSVGRPLVDSLHWTHSSVVLAPSPNPRQFPCLQGHPFKCGSTRCVEPPIEGGYCSARETESRLWAKLSL